MGVDGPKLIRQNLMTTSPVAGTAGAGATENTSKQATKNYEIDRTVAYTKQPAGRLRRITVAVLIDNLRTTSKDGSTGSSSSRTSWVGTPET